MSILQKYKHKYGRLANPLRAKFVLAAPLVVLLMSHCSMELPPNNTLQNLMLALLSKKANTCIVEQSKVEQGCFVE
ncbi:MAG: hypothetical protein KDK39_15895 [Leptospiraceae bacterium]|nr:hypothetical protein [Leptospiraceae bacterium]